jgi:flagellar basal-body rod modification protein FlgD
MATEVDPLSAYAAQTAAAAASGKKKTELGSQEFMQLMLTQLKNQDPFKPLDPAQFLGQLAQFSTVTGIQNMQSSMTELAGSLRSSQVLNGASLVGREVLAPSTTATHVAGGTLKGAVAIPGEGVANAQVAILDSAGQLVRRFDLTPASQGFTEFTWDGLDASGNPAASGEYEIEITAKSGGETYSFDPLLSSRVSSVTIDPTRGDLILNTDIGPVAIGDVARVK